MEILSGNKNEEINVVIKTHASERFVFKTIFIDLFSNNPNPNKITIMAKPDFGT